AEPEPAVEKPLIDACFPAAAALGLEIGIAEKGRAEIVGRVAIALEERGNLEGGAIAHREPRIRFGMVVARRDGESRRILEVRRAVEASACGRKPAFAPGRMVGDVEGGCRLALA